MEIIIPVLTLAALGLVFGIGLAFAAKRFRVNVDPRLEKIHGLLPGANCGACGGAGCFGFAEAILEGKALIDSCRVASDDAKEEIAKVMGRSLKKTAKVVAVLHCNGGTRVKDKYIYAGKPDCVAAAQVLGGQKDCPAGCLGFGTCQQVCPFGAITMSAAKLPVVDPNKCKACNKCVEICPKKLFTLSPVENTVYVACSLRYPGKDTKAVCPVGCIACKLCERACKFDAVHVIDNIAVIDPKKCTNCGECVKVCPSKCILVREKQKTEGQKR